VYAVVLQRRKGNALKKRPKPVRRTPLVKPDMRDQRRGGTPVKREKGVEKGRKRKNGTNLVSEKER